MDPIIDNDLYKEEDKQVVYGTVMPRFWAIVIDGFVLLPVTIPMLFLNFIYWKSVPLFIVGSIINILYKPFCEYMFGMTVGKKMMKLRVQTYDFESINVGEALSRNIFNLLSGVLTVVLSVPLFSDPDFLKISTVIDYTEYMQHYPILDRLNIAMFPVLMIEMVFLSTDLRRRSLHDRIARTVVVKLSK
ncbi:MAG: RDD family protein [Bacteroidetes bacterium]|nr:RDD family protein [Bacteroidota bacterium]